jgi:hypothetical protein
LRGFRAASFVGARRVGIFCFAQRRKDKKMPCLPRSGLFLLRGDGLGDE